MSGNYTYPYPAHYITTDIVVFTFHDKRLKILLVQRAGEPYAGRWALPGGFMGPQEELEACARRELAEETALEHYLLEQFMTVGTVGRDPRGRVVTVAYLALARWDPNVRGGTDARKANWFDANELPPLAFDHVDIIGTARARLQQMLGERPMVFLRLLPDEFSVDDMQAVHTAVLGRREGRLGGR